VPKCVSSNGLIQCNCSQKDIPGHLCTSGSGITNHWNVGMETTHLHVPSQGSQSSIQTQATSLPCLHLQLSGIYFAVCCGTYTWWSWGANWITLWCSTDHVSSRKYSISRIPYVCRHGARAPKSGSRTPNTKRFTPSCPDGPSHPNGSVCSDSGPRKPCSCQWSRPCGPSTLVVARPIAPTTTTLPKFGSQSSIQPQAK
jgi:hypothetical protein